MRFKVKYLVSSVILEVFYRYLKILFKIRNTAKYIKNTNYKYYVAILKLMKINFITLVCFDIFFKILYL